MILSTPYHRHNPVDISPELARDRARNDNKLKTRFERIFEKYNKDFSQVGDEIDLRTGQLVIDNGHLSRMQNERDPGSSASKSFVRAFTQELGSEERRASRASDTFHGHERVKEISGLAKLVEDEDDEDDEDDDSGDELSSSPSRQNSIEAESLHSTPQIAESVEHRRHELPADPVAAMVSNITRHVPNAHGNLQPDAVQELGQALANQIASFLSSHLPEKGPPAPTNPWTFPRLPEDGPADRAPSSAGSVSTERRSLSPVHGDSLWVSENDRARLRELEYDEEEAFFIAPAEPSEKRRKYTHSIVPDHFNAVVPSFEHEHTRNGIRPHYAFYQPDAHAYRAEDGQIIPDFTCYERSTRQEENEMRRQKRPDDQSAFENAVDGTSSFYQSARHNFQLLAHGFVNRGFLGAHDTVPRAKYSPVKKRKTEAEAQRIKHSSRYDEKGRRIHNVKNGVVLKRFSDAEDALILRLREKENMSWTQIASFFPDRTQESVAVRYGRALKAGGDRCNSSKRTRIVELLNDGALPDPGDQWNVQGSPADETCEGRVQHLTPALSDGSGSRSRSASVQRPCFVSDGQIQQISVSTAHDKTAGGADAVPQTRARSPNAFSRFGQPRAFDVGLQRIDLTASPGLQEQAFRSARPPLDPDDFATPQPQRRHRVTSLEELTLPETSVFCVGPSKTRPGKLTLRKKTGGRPSAKEAAEKERITIEHGIAHLLSPPIKDHPPSARHGSGKTRIKVHPDEVQRAIDKISWPVGHNKSRTKRTPTWITEDPKPKSTKKNKTIHAAVDTSSTPGMSAMTACPIDGAGIRNAAPGLTGVSRVVGRDTKEASTANLTGLDRPKMPPQSTVDSICQSNLQSASSSEISSDARAARPARPAQPPSHPHASNMVYDFPLDPTLRVYSDENLENDGDDSTPATSPDESPVRVSDHKQKSSWTMTASGRRQSQSSASSRSSAVAGSLRTSTLRRSFVTPAISGGRSSVSSRSSPSVISGPVPTEDASDDEL